ncbi:MAG: porphobilinogen synthase [Candidatus Heimdallarchaeota archaeon]|nr:porphobilinogen synthase [Candidatus Heimdallarchaeota archaeon]
MIEQEKDKQHFYSRIRPRRLRISQNIQKLIGETSVSTSNLIYPLFIRHGENQEREIISMPGQKQFSVDRLKNEIEELIELGIPAVLLFGIPKKKDWCGSDNFDSEGIIPTAIKCIKELTSELVVISDMCFCEYTSHGHCGIINTADHEYFNENLPEGYLLNDITLDYLAKASLIHAQAGADMIAPSGMLDGMVGSIRDALDRGGYEHVGIMSYAAKYSSSFYGPFREAAESPPSFGNRNQYQMDPRNAREAIKEVEIDITEGADIIMVKPALPYLDIISNVRKKFNLPVAAYQVSGEFSMIHAAAERGWIDLKKVALESLISIKRAGASLILTYFAKDFAKWSKEPNF